MAASTAIGGRFASISTGGSRRRPDRHPDVVGADDRADQEQQAADGARDVVGMHRDQRVDEGIGQRAALVVGPPHQPLDDAGIPHREDVDDGAGEASQKCTSTSLAEYMRSRFHSHGTTHRSSRR